MRAFIRGGARSSGEGSQLFFRPVRSEIPANIQMEIQARQLDTKVCHSGETLAQDIDVGAVNT